MKPDFEKEAAELCRGYGHDSALMRGAVRAALLTTWNAAIEDAAKVADEAENQQDIDHGAANTGGAAQAAAAIRALKATP